MNQLREDPRLWRQIVPVAFHVDYWDYIGWPDRFAVPANAELTPELIEKLRGELADLVATYHRWIEMHGAMMPRLEEVEAGTRPPARRSPAASTASASSAPSKTVERRPRSTISKR